MQKIDHHEIGEIWVRGELHDSDSYAVAIVGSRKAAPSSLESAFRLGKELGEAGVCVVSGLAKGIDGEAHSGALAGGGRTLGVLGTGLNHIYPACHRDLALQITHSGALISSFEPSFRGASWSFPRRNKIIAQLSRVLIVVEAGEKSGTQSALRVARRLRRPVGLLQSLVSSSPWAARLADEDDVFIVSSTADVLERMGS